jgi:hypothetical protein
LKGVGCLSRDDDRRRYGNNKRKAIVPIETPFERFRLAHKSILSFTGIEERCKEGVSSGIGLIDWVVTEIGRPAFVAVYAGSP